MVEEVVERVISIIRSNMDKVKYNYQVNNEAAITSVTYVHKGRRKSINVFNLHLSIKDLSIIVEQYEDILLCKIYLNGYRKTYAIRNHLENSIYDICERVVNKSVRKTPEDVLNDLKQWERDYNIDLLSDKI